MFLNHIVLQNLYYYTLIHNHMTHGIEAWGD